MEGEDEADSSVADAAPDVKNGATIEHQKDTRVQYIRTILLVSTSLYMFLYGGAFFGWGPMQLMLEDSGAFASRCSPDEELPCPSQTSMLLNVQFVAQLTLISSPLLGAGVDKFGPTAMINLLFCMGVIGLALLTTATSLSIDYMLFPSFISLGFMANCCGLMTVQTGLVFSQERSRNRTISGLNSLFDAGAITFLGMWYIEENTSLDLPTLAGIYLAVFVLVVGVAAICWRYVSRILEPQPQSDSDAKGSSADILEPQPEHNSVVNGDNADIANDSVERGQDVPPRIFDDNDISADPSDSKDRAVSFAEAQHLDTTCTTSSDRFVADETPPSPDESLRASSYVMIADRTPRKQMMSGMYIALAVFFAFHQARNIWVLTTTRDFLAYLGDDETGNLYLSIFTLLTPISVLGLPFVDAILHRYGYGAGLQVVNILGMAQGIVQVSSKNLNVQILGFLFYSFYRCFLFSVSFSCLPAFLGGRILGKGYGFLILSGGVLGLINIPLANVAVNLLNGNFFLPNLLYLIGCIPCSCLAWRVGRGFKKEKKELTRLLQSKLIAAG